MNNRKQIKTVVITRTMVITHPLSKERRKAILNIHKNIHKGKNILVGPSPEEGKN